ncbi:hypothetical protein [Lactobacillus sp.]|uniref:hypothetical protein n=1 Tax=Lactobacillus sp. TaxID=1591 RepID=UPI0025865D1C|nr:hypothetical protein [Lactobacillus sp.]MCO6530339.1 hypothetical protein [Lactobacillus sp.]MCO6530601.1 hypothetical protein [Lactobacillus sp.]
MATCNLSVRYAGDAITDGRIPIRDLAPSLLALSESFQQIQQVIDPDSDPVSLDIKATSEGSFIVDLILANGKDLISHVVNLLNSDPTAAALNLSTIVTTFYGVIRLIKKLYNRKIKKQENLNNGDIKLTLDKNESITISKGILDSYQNINIRTSVHNLVKPLEKDGINSLEINSNKNISISVKKTEYNKFDVPKINDKELDDKVTTEYLQIENIAFEHNNKWKFSEDTNKFWASIEDKDFLEKVEKNQTQFGSTDILKVRLRKKTYSTNEGLKNDYIIEKVLEHQKGAQQIELNFEDDK